MVTETIDRYISTVDPDRFDVVQDFSALFPVEVITQMLGVPRNTANKFGEWVDLSLHREPGQVEVDERVMQAIANIMGLYYNLIQQRRGEPEDDMISRLLETEVEREDGRNGTTG